MPSPRPDRLTSHPPTTAPVPTEALGPTPTPVRSATHDTTHATARASIHATPRVFAFSLLPTAVVALVTFVALVASACTGGSDEATASAPDTTSVSTVASGDIDGWTPDPLVWRTCESSRRHHCATLVVPLDWSDPDGETIELAVARLPSTGANVGSLIMNPGGPGGSGVQFLTGSDFNDTLTDSFDLVSWDPRGVGDSTALSCAGPDTLEEFLANDPSPDDEAERAALDQDARRIADDCSGSGSPQADLAKHIGTDNVARDLEALRLALGDESLNYLGFSYGTMVGLRYLAAFPTHVRAMVLDAVVDPTEHLETWLLNQATAFETALQATFDECTTKCPVDDLAAAYDELHALVERAPVPAGNGRKLGPAELETAAIYISYSGDASMEFARAVSEALNDGDGTSMYEIAQGYYDLSGYAAYAAVECVDSEHPVGSEAYAAFTDRVIAAAPRLGASVASELLPCAFWNAPVASVSGPVTGDGSPPILVVGNTGDAATPYSNATNVADMLTNGVLVTYHGNGHTSYGRSSCIDTIVERYLIDLEVPTQNPQCGK
ncbi:MAG: alpha/beta hydrolase [Microthrixaceae bacterium]